MDSPSADEKVEKGKDGASSQEEGSAEDHGEEGGALGKREHPTEPQEEKKTKKSRRESRWDSDKEWSKYADQKQRFCEILVHQMFKKLFHIRFTETSPRAV